jgi:hypothetical protein
MMKNIFKKLIITSLVALPVCLFANSTELCAGQPYQAILAQCATSVDACITIIKYNCLSNSPSAAIQLAQINEAMAQQYTMQVMKGGSVSAANPESGQSQQLNTDQLVHNQSAMIAKEQQQAMKTVKQQQPKSNKQTNYWF